MSFRFDQDQLETFAKEKLKVINTLISFCVADIGKKEDEGNRGSWVDGINKWIKAQVGSSYCVSWIHYKLYQTTQMSGWTFGVFRSPSCKETADKTPSYMKVKKEEIQAGDIVIWKTIGLWTGHAAIVEKVLDSEKIQTIEANTSPSIEHIEREGGGCFRKVRPIDGIGKMKLYSIIRPTIGMTKL
jgi:hypothetical protein